MMAEASRTLARRPALKRILALAGRLVAGPARAKPAGAQAEPLTVSGAGGNGKRVAKLTGKLGCSTFAGTASLTVGSRDASEPAFFEIEAVDGGPGGGTVGDSFAFTVFFDPAQAPINHGIFGPKFTFTGEMVAGEVSIAPPTAQPLQG